MGSSPMELVGVYTTYFIKKTQSLFEEAYHWNIQAKFYSVRIPTQLCMNDMKLAMQYKYYFGVRVWIFQKEQQCCPLLSIFLFFLFLCIFVASLALSIYLSFVLFGIFSFVLFWDLLFVFSLGSFPHIKGNTLYITRMMEITHFIRSTQHKEN